MSDLHIDLNHFGDFEIETLIAVLKSEQIDWLHIAGDTSNHHYRTSLPFYQKLADTVRLTYNLGNHDMLDLTEEVIEETDFQVYHMGETKLLAFHGWYDYSFHPQRTEEDTLRFKNIFWFDRRIKRPLSDKELTQAISQRLEEKLASLTGTVIVAMHFVPHSRFTMTHPKFQPFNAFLGSQVFHDIFRKYQVPHVVFGHAHRSYGSQTIDSVRYHSRPLGYIREWNLTIDFVSQNPNYNPSGTWNLSKRYNQVKELADYQAYKKDRLAQEFRQAMTIIDDL